MRLRQILLNLLSNACKFTKDGEICLRATPIQHEGRQVIEFSVTDTGIGMTPDQMTRLFEEVLPSRRNDRTPLRRYRPRLGDHTPALPVDGWRCDGG